MRNFTLDGRLSSAGKFVRRGAVFADIGTDHGYLPLSLLEGGVIERAICSDINEGPLGGAIENARECGLAHKCRFVLTDGAAALSNEGITDLAICGMGGELIADIIEKAPFLRDTGVRLILQPMSRQAKLRQYLAVRGFNIIAEDYSYSQDKYYLTVAAEFSGVPYSLSTVEAHFGKEKFLLPISECCRGYLNAKRKALKRSFDGKTLGGEDTAEEECLLEYLDKILR